MRNIANIVTVSFCRQCRLDEDSASVLTNYFRFGLAFHHIFTIPEGKLKLLEIVRLTCGTCCGLKSRIKCCEGT